MAKIIFCNNTEPKVYENGCKKCVEDVIKDIAKELNIKPLCWPLYGLRNTNNKKLEWVCLSKKIAELIQNATYQFRIRFQTYSTIKLKGIDYESYVYFFYQTRYDFMQGNITPYIQHQKQDGLGLIVTDVLHYLASNPDKTFNDIEMRSFMPNNLNTMPNRANVKRNAERLMDTKRDYFMERGPIFFKDQYLETVEDHQTGRLREHYALEMDEGDNSVHIDLCIDPFHPELPGLYHKFNKKLSKHVCSIEEIVFVSIRMQDLTVELSRENGTPIYYCLRSCSQMESLVGALSGYYRLMKTWAFDLCRELPTPSLSFLKSHKCHGPVGQDFVLSKLRSRSCGQAGIGILRESSTEFNVYKLVVTQKSDQPHMELVIKKSKTGLYHFLGSDAGHKLLSDAIKWAIEKNYRECGLRRLLPPSEFDRASQLLLCCSKKRKNLTKSSGPRILHLGMFIPKESEDILKGKFSMVYRCTWTDEGNEDCAVKVPKFYKGDKENFMNMMNKFLFVEGDCVVKVFGLTLNPVALVMQFLPLGSLHKYLQNNKDTIRMVDLVEASSHLAKALCDLQLKDVSHYNIRCHNILVAEHTDHRFKVKLSDAGKVEYSNEDIHWIPREHLDHPSSALADSTTDTWAFGTTLWQMFSYGILPLDSCQPSEVKAVYKEGRVLGCPDGCPQEIYKIMTSCWHKDPHSRRHPQSLVQDIQQIFYYTYNSRRESSSQKNQYSRIDRGDSIDSNSDDDDETLLLKDEDQVSISTQVTTLTQDDGSLLQVNMNQIMNYPLIPPEIAMPGTCGGAPSYAHTSVAETPKTLMEILVPPPWNSPEKDILSSETQFQLNNSTIDIVQRIGKGNYGYVFKGRMTFLDNRMEYVALKRLQSVGSSSDFKKEMDIMKNLRHENIVSFHGLIESDQEGLTYQYMVMEYLSLGSLQDYLLSNHDDRSLISDQRLLAFSLDIAKGMDYLENKQIIHRDLATRNVLVETKEHVKITDFGLAQRPNQGNYYILRTNRELPIKWYALESIEHGKYSHKTDVWSYGVTLWEMFTRGLVPDLPNDGCKLIEFLKCGKRLVCKQPCDPNIYSRLIRPCWDEDPKSRPDFTRLRETVSEIQEGISF